MQGVYEAWGDAYDESTRSEEATAFRVANHKRIIDAEYVELRESLYLKLSHQALLAMAQSETGVVTPDSSLVTRVSHSVMRRVIGEPYLDNIGIIEEWQADEARADADAPDMIVLTHAPFSTIRSRIVARQDAGDALESFWGFNSPTFLEAYQERWKTVLRDLAQQSYVCLAINTSETSPEDGLRQYAAIRESVALV